VNRNSDGNLIAMGRNMAIILSTRGTERASQRVAYGSKIMSMTATRSNAASVWPSGTRTPAR
jgi:uncharacterized membrane protein YoaK (UPF0700 family)